MPYKFTEFDNEFLNESMKRDPLSNGWEKLIAGFNDKPVDILEIGTFEGRTACWLSDNILDHPRSTLDLVDCFAYEVTPEMTKFNLNQSKNSNKIRLYETTSTNFFNENKKEYDLIYVDADHDFGQAYQDCADAYGYLKAGGLLIVDDVRGAHPGVSKALAILQRKWDLVCIQDALTEEYIQSIYIKLI